MGPRQTLYEMLGVAPNASTAELQAAYRERAGELEAARASLRPQEYQDKAQLLRLALSTLSDPVTRVGYDAKLSEARAAGPALALAPLATGASAGQGTVGGSSAEIRAEALSLRADALALRADAMLARAGIEAPGAGDRGLATGAITWGRRIASALGLSVMVIFIATVAFTRCSGNDPADRRAPYDGKPAQKAEKAALQEYYQTYGVRPANMAELELLEAERKRRANQETQQNLGREEQDRRERQFEEDSRRRADAVSRQLRYDEDRARYEARVDAENERREKLVKQEIERRQQEAEQERADRDRERWREELRR